MTTALELMLQYQLEQQTYMDALQTTLDAANDAVDQSLINISLQEPIMADLEAAVDLLTNLPPA